MDCVEEAYERAGEEIRGGYELRTAVRSLNFLMNEWANRGLNLWTVDTQTFNTVVGQTSYTLPADTVDVLDMTYVVPGVSPTTEITLERITVSQYSQTVNKQTPGPPIRFFVQRLENAPVVYLWQSPDQVYTINYWRLRRMQDAGGITNTFDIPPRFWDAMCAGLAYRTAIKKQKPIPTVQGLKALYDEAWQMAADEDRDRSSFYFVPDSPFT